ncbi:hypothetical protein ElyMa_002791700 [Elysia marginata]|uniref:Uncharacterized protein n=1 Tax=Elysia marginata TaxID=1093978 RepID=A0AAV4HPA5_9GAST|nr:hypothetical protein ElyMa_002791700 [Elysia marginata]
MIGLSPFCPGLLIRPGKPDLYRSNPSYLKGLRYPPPATRWVGDGTPLPSSMIPDDDDDDDHHHHHHHHHDKRDR